MVPRGLPYNESTEPTLAVKQSVRNSNTHAITYLPKMILISVSVHSIKLLESIFIGLLIQG